MESVLVSACLLGEAVRYNGGDKRCEHHILQRWIREGRVVPICPEVTRNPRREWGQPSELRCAGRAVVHRYIFCRWRGLPRPAQADALRLLETTVGTADGSTEALAELPIKRDQISGPFVRGIRGVRVRDSYQRCTAIAR